MNNNGKIPEDSSWLCAVHCEVADVSSIIEGLREDKVMLIAGASAGDADRLIAGVAEQLGLRNQLGIQTAFASVLGHRSNVGKHFMTVNKRAAYQFVPAHSEGNRLMNMQLASLYCYENSTDGGESILMNTDSDSPAWSRLRALNRKVDICGKNLSPAEAAAAKMMHQISIPESVLNAEDLIVAEQPSPIPGVKVYDALSKVSPTFSRILGREVMTYWDDVASTDFDSVEGYYRLLQAMGLLRSPPGGMQIENFDTEYPRRVWRSGISYETLFRRKITYKLCPGDLIIQNNLTWTHSTANWTPGSGHRKVVAAFA